MIKKLVWSEQLEPNNDIRYHHVVANTPFGRIVIDWKGWKQYPQYDITCPWNDEHGWCEEHHTGETTLQATMTKAEQVYLAKVKECLN